MKKIILILTLFLTGCGVVSTNSEQELKNEDKIIATSFATVEILDKLNLDLVGVPKTSRQLPERYQEVTEVGSPMNPDLEVINLLNPTDIIGPSTLESSLKEGYDKLGLNYTFINLKNLDEMHKDITYLGEKYNRQEEAKEIVDKFETFKNKIKERTSTEKKPRVLVLMGLPGAYVVATGNSYVGHLVEIAGGENVFSSDTEDFLNIGPEEMLNRDPDIILRASHALPEKVKEMFLEEFSTNDIWKHFKAVQNNEVYDLDYSLFGMSATLDYPEALETLQKILYKN